MRQLIKKILSPFLEALRENVKAEAAATFHKERADKLEDTVKKLYTELSKSDQDARYYIGTIEELRNRLIQVDPVYKVDTSTNKLH